MTTLFNEQNRIAKTLLYLLILLPFVARPQQTASLGSLNDATLYCDTSTLWNGTVWSNGEPEAGKDAVFAADYTFTGGILHACSINILEGAHINFTQNANAIIVHNVHVCLNAELSFESGSYLIQTEGQ